ncbi:hypothetical protein HAV15_011880 [Penicillium sp. str. |nr:hypothetical protein HAV15_011880 [Penicillium sp. str. \
MYGVAAIGSTAIPYYDTIEFDAAGNFIEPPPGVALSDALVFLIVSSEGDIYAERWPLANPSFCGRSAYTSYRYTENITCCVDLSYV